MTRSPATFAPSVDGVKTQWFRGRSMKFSRFSMWTRCDYIHYRTRTGDDRNLARDAPSLVPVYSQLLFCDVATGFAR